MSASEASRWARVQQLFAAALEVPEAERRAYVTAHCENDADLALEVLSLLAADAESPDYLDEMAGGLADFVRDADTERPDRLVGQTLDRYTIESRLASGGMGAVYLARRSDGTYRERVAVKVIRRGMDSDSVVARFRVERQILARLRHPNLANLLDGGVTDDGRPYLVMEYVEGRPIDQYCTEERLDAAARLQLMQTVCAAVQHAHNNLVVHRDLKPANILVTDTGEVKLMDFGIAKLLADADASGPVGEAPDTLPGIQVLTPGYAAPEQITGDPITTATDVFGLGIVLYQLLTGTRPFGGHESTADEIARATCEREPRRPEPGGRGEATGLPAHRLAGDLDNICLMALRREPERRYATPGHLSEDLGRHLAGEPVAARAPTLRYRTSKLIGRYRRAFAALAACLVLVTALVSGYTVRLAHERDRARRGEAKAEQVAAFLTDLFALADPEQSRGADITAREILTRGAERVRTDLADQPALQSAMLDVLGEVHASLGLYEEGRELLGRSLALKRGLHGDDHLESAATMAGLARLEAAAGGMPRPNLSYRRGRSVCTGSSSLRGTLPCAVDLQGLGLVAAHTTGRPVEAERYYRDALAIYQADASADGGRQAVCLNDLALLHLELGRRDESEPMFRQAIDLQQRLLGDDHPELANTLFNLALLLRERGDHKAAEPIQRRVLALDRQHYDDQHPNIAYSLMSLGGTLAENGAYQEAERVFGEALEIRRAVLEPGHPDLIKALGSLALTRHRSGRYREAEPLLREAVSLAREHLGKNRITAGRLDDLGWNLHERGRHAEALRLHEEALAMKLDLIGPDHKNTATTYMHMARAHGGIGDHAVALELQEKAAAIAEAAFGRENLYTATTELGLARILLAMGRTDEAHDRATAALAVVRRVIAPDNPRVGSALHLAGAINQARGESDKA